MREGPPTAALVAMTAEKGGSFREWALAKAYTEARQAHGESELLDALVGEKPDLKRYKTPEELDAQGLGRLTEAVALLHRSDRRRGGLVPEVRAGRRAAGRRGAQGRRPAGERRRARRDRAS